jgi:hypothetical protein
MQRPSTNDQEEEDMTQDDRTPIENMRVVRLGDEFQHLSPPQPERSHAQQIQDEILNSAEDAFRTARSSLAEGIEMFTLLTTPQHTQIETLIGQLIEQVIEFRRIHR